MGIATGGVLALGRIQLTTQLFTPRIAEILSVVRASGRFAAPVVLVAAIYVLCRLPNLISSRWIPLVLLVVIALQLVELPSRPNLANGAVALENDPYKVLDDIEWPDASAIIFVNPDSSGERWRTELLLREPWKCSYLQRPMRAY